MLFSAAGNCVFNVSTAEKILSPGKHKSTLKIPGQLLNDGIYSVHIIFVRDTTIHVFRVDDLLTFEVIEEKREGNWFGKWDGAIRPTFLEFSLD